MSCGALQCVAVCCSIRRLLWRDIEWDTSTGLLGDRSGGEDEETEHVWRFSWLFIKDLEIIRGFCTRCKRQPVFCIWQQFELGMWPLEFACFWVEFFKLAQAMITVTSGMTTAKCRTLGFNRDTTTSRDISVFTDRSYAHAIICKSICVCGCVCVCVCVRMRVCVCICTCVHAGKSRHFCPWGAILLNN